MKREIDQLSEDLQSIDSRCATSRGHLIFVANLSERRDEEGFAIIDYQYQRHRISIEDAKRSLEKLAEFIKRELDDLSGEVDELVKF